MRRHLSLLCGLTLTLSLAACGGGAPQTPDAILQKMHERFVSQVNKGLEKTKVADVSQTTAEGEMSLTEIPGMLPASATLKFSTDQSYDMRDDKNLKLHVTADIDVAAKMPAALVGAQSSAPDGSMQVNAAIAFDGKTADNKLFLKLLKGMVSAPALKLNADIGEKVKQTWYGTTFEEINKKIAEGSTDELKPHIEDMLRKSFDQQRMMHAEASRLVENLHAWKGIETLPEENGMIRVRVESDREKLSQSFEAFTVFMKTMNDPFGTAGPSMDERIAQMRKEFDESLMKDGKTVKGILMADKDTFDFRGFDGEVFDAQGASQGTIKLLIAKDGDVTVEIAEKDKPDEHVSFTKKGENVELLVGGKKILGGTATKGKLHLEGYDEAGATQIIVDADIETLEADRMELTGKLTVPSAGIVVNVTALNLELSNDYKDMDMEMTMNAEFQAKPAFSMTMTAERQEISSVDAMAETSFQPFEALMVDLQPFVATLQAAGQH